MNMKINTICFILLFFFLICAVSAADNQNETLKQSNINQNPCESSINNIEKLDSSKKVYCSLQPLTKTTQKKANEKVSMSAPNVKMYYKNGQTYKVTIKNSKKTPIKNLKVKITINGATYTKTTDKTGTASLGLNLKSGKYNVLATFDGTSKYQKKSVTSTVTIKSTIKCSDLTKYYKNSAQYSATFFDKKGNPLKQASVKVKFSGKTYSFKTSKNGLIKLNIDANPGKHNIVLTNTKTSETITKTITIKNILITNDLTMNSEEGGEFKVKVLDSNGKPAANKNIEILFNGKIIKEKSDKNGIATVKIFSSSGKYNIQTKYGGIVNTNKIIVVKSVNDCEFIHQTLIPRYINVTAPYVFHNSEYSLKTGTNGIIKLPKNEIIKIATSKNSYIFTHKEFEEFDSLIIGYKTYLIPFDESEIKSDYNKNNLKGEGILISSTDEYTQIEYRSISKEGADMFGVSFDKGEYKNELITYLHNDNVKAQVSIATWYYDELGLRKNLAKLYGTNPYNTNKNAYDEITENNTHLIKYANTGEPITFNDERNVIVGPHSKESIITRFIVDGKEELEKIEEISYGLSKKYVNTFGFEIIQSYAILNKKLTTDIIEKWTLKSANYLSHSGIKNIYTMFLASLETGLIADELANQYAKDFNLNWERKKTATILGGINLDNTYLHILNADMSMTINGGDNQTRTVFRAMNSMYLPNIEEYGLRNFAKEYSDNTTNSITNIYESIEKNEFSIMQIDELFYIFTENNKNCTIVINSTSGVCEVLISDEDFAYKGAKICTSNDCCSVNLATYDVLKGLTDTVNDLKKGLGDLTDWLTKNFNALSILGAKIGKYAIDKLGKITNSPGAVVTSALLGEMLFIHTAGNYVKTNFVEKKDWHYAYDHIVFTRDGPLQGKKLFNIPKSNGEYDYVEVKINKDGSLNRNEVYYISNGNYRKLSKSESYKYFNEERWTYNNIPKKYHKFKQL